jgi:hypothetical protein
MQKRFTRSFFYCCLIFTLIIYFPSGLYFLADDLIHIPLSSKGELFQRNFLRPVHDILLSIDVFLWGKNPFGFHLTILIIHLLCSLALFWVTYSLFIHYKVMDRAKARDSSFLVTGLFLIYAFHSEAIFWIIGAGAALCTLFFLASIGCYLQKEKSFYLFLASLILFQIGLFTYEAIWIAPLAVICFFILDITLLKKNWKKELVWMLTYIFSFVVNLVVRTKIIGSIVNEYDLGSKTKIDISQLFLNFNRLLSRSFIPPMQSTIFFVCTYAIFIIVSIILLFYFFKKGKQTEPKIFGFLLICLFLLSFGPYLFLGINTHTRESERYLYLPSGILCIAIGYFISTANISYRFLKVICIFLFLYNAIYLYANRTDYDVAGEISKNIYKMVNDESKENKTVTVVNLPSQINGIPTFRSGFKEGLDWLYKTDTSKIIVDKTAALTYSHHYIINFSKQKINLPVKTKTDSVSNVILTIGSDEYFSFEPDSSASSKN